MSEENLPEKFFAAWFCVVLSTRDDPIQLDPYERKLLKMAGLTLKEFLDKERENNNG